MTNAQNDHKDTDNENPIKIVSEMETGGATLALDVDFYQSFLDDTDIPEDKKRELIETLWSIMTAFVDLGFGIHPVQQAKNQKTECSGMASAFAIECDENEPIKERKDA